MPALVEQLRARLGVEAVHGLERVPEHRPERAWRIAEPALPEMTREATRETPKLVAPHVITVPSRRPLWLLGAPQLLESPRGRPQQDGPLELSAGPERIESGWWDGDDARRDYYVAKDRHGSRLWIYRECDGARRWFLHGIFG
jgi:protein ImuB